VVDGGWFADDEIPNLMMVTLMMMIRWDAENWKDMGD